MNNALIGISYKVQGITAVNIDGHVFVSQRYPAGREAYSVTVLDGAF